MNLGEEGGYGRSLKRRASLTYDGFEDISKRRRCEEIAPSTRSNSVPMGQPAGYFQTSASTPQASSTTAHPYNAFEHTYPSPTSAYAGTEVQSTPWPANPPTGPWGMAQQPPGYQAGAGCSEMSDLTMEPAYASTTQTPQRNFPASEVQQQACESPMLDTQRSNSVPDLRLLLNSPLPPSGYLQPYAQRLPVMESSSTAGALVPFRPKAPEARHLF